MKLGLQFDDQGSNYFKRLKCVSPSSQDGDNMSQWHSGVAMLKLVPSAILLIDTLRKKQKL